MIKFIWSHFKKCGIIQVIVCFIWKISCTNIINSFLAILEKNEENLLGLIGFEKQNLLNLRSNITLDLIDVHSDKEKLLQCGKEYIFLWILQNS